MKILALSSGTSVDGIDVAVADLAFGERNVVVLTPVSHQEINYSPELRAQILAAYPPAATTLEQVCRLDTLIGQEFASAARRVAAEHADVELVVSHGQTLFHWVEDGAVRGTLQLGQPSWIAEATGLPVVSDVRVNDVAAGGQGAPLASLIDVLLMGGRDGIGAALNLGGIANITVAGAGIDPVAFDTGPANALLDVAIRRATDGQEHVDLDGVRAASGRINEALLEALLRHPYYARTAPKSTGKEDFHAGYLDEVLQATGTTDLDVADVLATLVELTARTIADALAPFSATEVFASGGGTSNPTLMRRLAHHLQPARLHTYDVLGLDPGAKEAYLFALIGFLTWHGLPGTVLSCTGAQHPTVAGRITPGSKPLRLPPPHTDSPAALLIANADRRS